jgi:hypothetical protein
VWWLTIDGAANTLGSSQDLLDVAGKVLGERFWTHLAGNFDDLVKSNVARVLDVLLLLPVAWGLCGRIGSDTGVMWGLAWSTLESLDNEGGGGGDNIDFGLSVLDRKLDGHP